MSINILPDGRCEFTVQGFSFQQNPKSPTLFAFVASANDLIKFCGVARKSQDLLTNYQRALDTTRVANEVTPFFRVPENCTPTSIVLSLHPTNVCNLDFAPVGVGEQSLGPGVSLKVLSLTFIDVSKLPPDEVVRYAKDFLDERLANEGEQVNSDPSPTVAKSAMDDSFEVVDEDEELASDNAEGDESNEDLDDGDTGDEEAVGGAAVEIGQSMLMQLRNKLDTPSSMTPDVIECLRDMLKPALVIDGQHRLFGAAGVEEDLPLLVCSLVEPSWKEQVFQFIVVNDKAAGIPKPFITSLAGMSLTGTELDELRDRLTQAGLKLWEVEVMQRLGFDPKSPFFKMIEFKVSSKTTVVASPKPEGLGYQTMKRVGRAWHDAKSTGLRITMEKLYSKPSGKKIRRKAALAKWQQSNDWFDFFCYFWGAFKTKFGDTPVWQLHSNLLKAVVLEVIQQDFLNFLNTLGELLYDFEEEDDQNRRKIVFQRYKKLLDNFVKKHEIAFYERDWKGSKSLNHSDGRKALANLFRKLREGESIANDPVITGNI